MIIGKTLSMSAGAIVAMAGMSNARNPVHMYAIVRIAPHYIIASHTLAISNPSASADIPREGWTVGEETPWITYSAALAMMNRLTGSDRTWIKEWLDGMPEDHASDPLCAVETSPFDRWSISDDEFKRRRQHEVKSSDPLSSDDRSHDAVVLNGAASLLVLAHRAGVPDPYAGERMFWKKESSAGGKWWGIISHTRMGRCSIRWGAVSTKGQTRDRSISMLDARIRKKLSEGYVEVT